MNHREIAEGTLIDKGGFLYADDPEEFSRLYDLAVDYALAVHQAIKETDVCEWKMLSNRADMYGASCSWVLDDFEHLAYKLPSMIYCTFCGRKIKEVE